MSRQFMPVNCEYGAPMGRSELHDQPAGKIRLFRVRLDSGGYDDGGAYWGAGAPLYCATDGEGYREFTRAASRAEAAAVLGIGGQLARRAGLPDGRYTVTLEWSGQPQQQWIARFCGDWLDRADNREEAEKICREHAAGRCNHA